MVDGGEGWEVFQNPDTSFVSTHSLIATTNCYSRDAEIILQSLARVRLASPIEAGLGSDALSL